MNVLPVLDAVLARLREKLPQLQVEYFPEKPAEYRLNHPVGALLLSYAGSRFDRPDDTGAVIQSQTIQLCVTVVFRQLNGKKGRLMSWMLSAAFSVATPRRLPPPYLADPRGVYR